MKIVFVGAVDFSRHCLRAALEFGGNVCSVVTLPAEKASRHADYADLTPSAASHGIPVHYTSNINAAETHEHLSSLNPDVIFVFGWSQIISGKILAIPPEGCVGTHPALLPKHRGRHPLIWALVEGLEETGLTFFFLDEGADSGDILWQRSIPIHLRDDATTMYEKIKDVAVQGIREILPLLEGGRAPRIRQDDEKATYWRKRTEKDGEIQWSASSMQAYNLIRGLTHPYPGAHSFCDGVRLVVWKADPPGDRFPDRFMNDRPGTIVDIDNEGLTVRTKDGVLKLRSYELHGERTLRKGNWLGVAT